MQFSEPLHAGFETDSLNQALRGDQCARVGKVMHFGLRRPVQGNPQLRPEKLGHLRPDEQQVAAAADVGDQLVLESWLEIVALGHDDQRIVRHPAGEVMLAHDLDGLLAFQQGLERPR